MALKSIRQALNEALAQEMRRDPRVVVIGEDVAGGAGSVPARRSHFPVIPRCDQTPTGVRPRERVRVRSRFFPTRRISPRRAPASAGRPSGRPRR